VPSIGPLEILFVGIIALIVFGPQRLPEIARTIGKTLAEFRRQAAEVRAEFESGLDEDAPVTHPDPPEASGSVASDKD
jgi:Tat protein translocase TatB subunit